MRIFPKDVIFTTRDFAIRQKISISAASKRLLRLSEAGELTSITRGLWANTSHPHFSPYACVPFLLGNEQGYISFLTALHLCDMLSQIPAAITVATTGRARTLCSPVGSFEFYQLKPEFIRLGVSWSDTAQPYRIATCEKALIDTFYLATRKGKRFSSLPELDFSVCDNNKFFRTLEQLAEVGLELRLKNSIVRRYQELKLQV